MDNRNENLKCEALRIMESSEGTGIPIRLLGGMAIYLTSPSTQTRPFAREIHDLDFAVSPKKSYPFGKLLEKIGFQSNHEFNSIHGESRMLFYSDLMDVDVFVGQFEQCHSMNLEKLFPLSKPTIPLANLLLTKLQVFQINEKDILDILALIHDHEIHMDGDPAEIISLNAVNAILSDDWGWYTTCTDNLEKIQAFMGTSLPASFQPLLSEKIKLIQYSVINAKKSLRWTIRSKVGRKVKWYELPEEK